MKKIPELLAPAGGLEQLKAAVENGADAVYFGGKLFNARINADNFDEEAMKEAIDYAHIRNVRVYVTMNILLKEKELEPAIEYAKHLYEMGVDALILQDIGFARMMKRRLPCMKIHLSTQGTVYNASGVKAAKKMGFERVVLARELSLEEIKTITQENLLEIEVFVHGALCICYSGQCQMSRILGGRSGNRGLCAQPCRLPFLAEGESKEEHLLSPKDICTIDFLGELVESGVASLKIEGRMKSPEYVATVTGIYRKYLNEYLQKGSYKVSSEDRQKLNQIFNRGGFTDGYLKGNPEEELMSTVLPKHQGTYLGKVVASAERDLIDIELEGELNIGDGIEIRNKNLPGNVVTFLKPIKGQIVRIGDIKGKVWAGDKVYKITDKALMKSARESYKDSHRQCLKKAAVKASFTVQLGEYPTLTITDGCSGNVGIAFIQITVTGSERAEKAINRPLTIENISKQLCKTGDIPFDIIHANIDVEEGVSLPVSVINQMRRQAFEQLIAEKTKPRVLSQEELERFNGLSLKKENQNNQFLELDTADPIKSLTLYFHTTQRIKENVIRNTINRVRSVGMEWDKLYIYVPLYDFMETFKDSNEPFPWLTKAFQGLLSFLIFWL
ncbi:peptidase U32 family protein [Clostridium aminobutyricum]|uniref:U32 family peptidase n=1 Tax=Clostridium aminobutyricum TaxID=33953 RepID=A0A939IJW6_CLOAM|nr:U32 family peptidase [Clostridium aminobutyricum]MBN7774013.1 U32 family peptidase [Clostridium aminobutyricum]